MTTGTTGIPVFVQGSRKDIALSNSGTVAQRLFTIPVGGHSVWIESLGTVELTWGPDNTTDADTAATADKEVAGPDILPRTFTAPFDDDGVIQRFLSIVTTSDFNVTIYQVK